MNVRLLSRSNHVRIDAAIIAPTPGDSGEILCSAPSTTASSVPNVDASTAAAAGPRCLIPRAVSSRGSGRVLDAVDSGDQLLGADLGEAFEAEQVVDGQRVDVGRVGDEAALRELGDGAFAETLDVHRPARRQVDRSAASRCAGHVGSMQRRSASPSRRTSGLPHAGHVAGNVHGSAALGAQRQHRADDLGDDVAGLAHDHGVAGADVLGAHLVLVVQRRRRRRWSRRRTPARARRTGSPARCARSATWMSWSSVVRSSGGNL